MCSRKENSKNARKPLSAAEVHYLWMVSGGLCSFERCRKRLVSSTNGDLTNTGIIAHIIGHAKTSARHEYAEQYGYNSNELELVSNLTLMCQHHAKLIDDHHTRDNYPPDLLFKMKRDHEDWVASWAEDKKKKSIALIYKKLGPPITELTFGNEIPFILLEAIEDQNEFLNFTPEGWLIAKKANEKLIFNFKEKIHQQKADVVELFPLSPIPLLVHLGFLLTDTIPISVYQYDRQKLVWVTNSEDNSIENRLNLQDHIVNNNEKDLVITVQVSGSIKADDIDDVITAPYDLLEVTISDPGVKRILYSEDVKKVQSFIKEKAEMLIQQNRYERIHLFYAGPAGLAIEIGRGINPRMWSEVYLYQYNFRESPKYALAFSI